MKRVLLILLLLAVCFGISNGQRTGSKLIQDSLIANIFKSLKSEMWFMYGGTVYRVNFDSATDGQSLVWSAARNAWIPHTVTGGGGLDSADSTTIPIGAIAAWNIASQYRIYVNPVDGMISYFAHDTLHSTGIPYWMIDSTHDPGFLTKYGGSSASIFTRDRIPAIARLPLSGLAGGWYITSGYTFYITPEGIVTQAIPNSVGGGGGSFTVNSVAGEGQFSTTDTSAVIVISGANSYDQYSYLAYGASRNLSGEVIRVVTDTNKVTFIRMPGGVTGQYFQYVRTPGTLPPRTTLTLRPGANGTSIVSTWVNPTTGTLRPINGVKLVISDTGYVTNFALANTAFYHKDLSTSATTDSTVASVTLTPGIPYYGTIFDTTLSREGSIVGASQKDTTIVGGAAPPPSGDIVNADSVGSWGLTAWYAARRMTWATNGMELDSISEYKNGYKLTPYFSGTNWKPIYRSSRVNGKGYAAIDMWNKYHGDTTSYPVYSGELGTYYSDLDTMTAILVFRSDTSRSTPIYYHRVFDFGNSGSYPSGYWYDLMRVSDIYDQWIGMGASNMSGGDFGEANVRRLNSPATDSIVSDGLDGYGTGRWTLVTVRYAGDSMIYRINAAKCIDTARSLSGHTARAMNQFALGMRWTNAPGEDPGNRWCAMEFAEILIYRHIDRAGIYAMENKLKAIYGTP
jgi:hypothetical protein